MSVDVLQKKIRKLKNPAMVVFAPTADLIPQGYDSAEQYCCALLEALKEHVPAVRIHQGAFALLGPDGLVQMDHVMKKARELEYYILLDWGSVEEPALAEAAARKILEDECWDCDGVVIGGYAGTDCIKPYAMASEAKKKDVFVVLKTANKSGSELQDLQTGGRHVFTASADRVNRLAESCVERCGYSRIGAMAGANSEISLKSLREKYPKMFLLVDGMEAPNSNAKFASAAFDRMGYGAVCCAGSSVLGAWKTAEKETDPLKCAVDAVDRLKRNINRYITIL